MPQYDEITIKWPNAILKVVGEFTEFADHVRFDAILIYQSESYNDKLIYKTWVRKKLGYFDPDSMLAIPDPKLVKIAHKFEKMGQQIFNIRFQSLLNARKL